MKFTQALDSRFRGNDHGHGLYRFFYGLPHLRLAQCTPSGLACVGCVGLLLGVFCAPWAQVGEDRLLFALLAAFVLAAWGWERPVVRVAAVAAAFVSFGLLRYSWSQPRLGPTFISAVWGRQATITGVVVREPDVRLSHVKLTLGSLHDRQGGRFSGRLLVTARLYPEYSYGDELQVSGTFKPPEPFDDFAYDRYLARSGIYAVSYHPVIRRIASGRGHVVSAMLLAVKARAQHAINRGLPEPSASIFSAIVLGSRQGLPPALVSAFNATGLTHLVAISGAQITLFVTLLSAVLPYLGIHRRAGFYLISALLGAYLVLIGLPASAVRAGVMGWLVVFASHVGRSAQAWRLLLYAAVAMVVANPKILRDDVGFQLSFAAVAGLLWLQPLLERWLAWVPEWRGFRTALAMTVAATVFTLPLIAVQFGRISLVSLATNVLVFPVTTAVMLAGLVGLAVGPWLADLAWVIWLPTHLPLAYLAAVAVWFTRLPFAQLTVPLPTFLLLPSYVALAVGVRRLKRLLDEQRRYAR